MTAQSTTLTHYLNQNKITLEQFNELAEKKENWLLDLAMILKNPVSDHIKTMLKTIAKRKSLYTQLESLLDNDPSIIDTLLTLTKNASVKRYFLYDAIVDLVSAKIITPREALSGIINSNGKKNALDGGNIDYFIELKDLLLEQAAAGKCIAKLFFGLRGGENKAENLRHFFDTIIANDEKKNFIISSLMNSKKIELLYTLETMLQPNSINKNTCDILLPVIKILPVEYTTTISHHINNLRNKNPDGSIKKLTPQDFLLYANLLKSADGRHNFQKYGTCRSNSIAPEQLSKQPFAQSQFLHDILSWCVLNKVNFALLDLSTLGINTLFDQYGRNSETQETLSLDDILPLLQHLPDGAAMPENSKLIQKNLLSWPVCYFLYAKQQQNNDNLKQIKELTEGQRENFESVVIQDLLFKNCLTINDVLVMPNWKRLYIESLWLNERWDIRANLTPADLQAAHNITEQDANEAYLHDIRMTYFTVNGVFDAESFNNLNDEQRKNITCAALRIIRTRRLQQEQQGNHWDMEGFKNTTPADRASTKLDTFKELLQRNDPNSPLLTQIHNILHNDFAYRARIHNHGAAAQLRAVPPQRQAQQAIRIGYNNNTHNSYSQTMAINGFSKTREKFKDILPDQIESAYKATEEMSHHMLKIACEKYWHHHTQSLLADGQLDKNEIINSRVINDDRLFLYGIDFLLKIIEKTITIDPESEKEISQFLSIVVILQNNSLILFKRFVSDVILQNSNNIEKLADGRYCFKDGTSGIDCEKPDCKDISTKDMFLKFIEEVKQTNQIVVNKILANNNFNQKIKNAVVETKKPLTYRLILELYSTLSYRELSGAALKDKVLTIDLATEKKHATNIGTIDNYTMYNACRAILTLSRNNYIHIDPIKGDDGKIILDGFSFLPLFWAELQDVCPWNANLSVTKQPLSEQLINVFFTIGTEYSLSSDETTLTIGAVQTDANNQSTILYSLGHNSTCGDGAKEKLSTALVGLSPLFGFNYVDADTIASFLKRRVEALTVDYLLSLTDKAERKKILDYIRADDFNKPSPMEYLWKYVGNDAVQALIDNASELTLGARYLTAEKVDLKKSSIATLKDLEHLTDKERAQCEIYRSQAQSVINNIADRDVSFISIDREIWLSEVMHRLTAAYLKAQPEDKRYELLKEMTLMLEQKEQSPFVRVWNDIKGGVQKELIETYQARLTAQQIKEKVTKPSLALSNLAKIDFGNIIIEKKTHDATECAFQALIDNYANVTFSMKDILDELAKLLRSQKIIRKSHASIRKRSGSSSENDAENPSKHLKVSGNRFSFHSLSGSNNSNAPSDSDELKIVESDDDDDMNELDDFGSRKFI